MLELDILAKFAGRRLEFGSLADFTRKVGARHGALPFGGGDSSFPF